MFNIVKKIINKYREQLLYIIFGVLTTLVNWIIYTLVLTKFNVDIGISNTLAWLFSVIFAYITNKVFVFKSKTWKKHDLLKEIILFFSGRLISGAIEILGFPLLYYVGIDQSALGIDGFAAKIVISVIVVIINYVLSKVFIFK